MSGQYSLGGLFDGHTAQQAHEENEKSGALPDGDYVFALVAATPKATKSKKTPGHINQGLSMRLDVQEGPLKNRVQFHHIGIQHESPEYMAQGRNWIGSLAVALGHTGQVLTIDPFMNRLVVGTVKGRKNKESGEWESRITKFRPYTGALPMPPQKPAGPSHIVQTTQVPPTQVIQPQAAPPAQMSQPVYQNAQPAPAMAAPPPAPTAAGSAAPPWAR